MAFDAVPAKIAFDVVSFKPCPDGKFGDTKVDQPTDGDYLAYHCETIWRLLYFSYSGSVAPFKIASGYPAWVDTDRYEFIVKVAPEDIPAWQKLDLSRRRVLIRPVLVDALKLKIRVDDTQVPIYALTVGKSPLKLVPYKDGDHTKMPNGEQLDGRTIGWQGTTAYYQGSTMQQLADTLTQHMDKPVIDQTNLKGQFNFSLPIMPGTGNDLNTRLGDDGATLGEGFRGLGLRLELTKAPVPRLVIDHIERPPQN